MKVVERGTVLLNLYILNSCQTFFLANNFIDKHFPNSSLWPTWLAVCSTASHGQRSLGIPAYFVSLEVYVYIHAIQKFPVLLNQCFSKWFESWSPILIKEQRPVEYNVENLGADTGCKWLKSKTQSVFSHNCHYHIWFSRAFMQPIKLKLWTSPIYIQLYYLYNLKPIINPIWNLLFYALYSFWLNLISKIQLCK